MKAAKSGLGQMLDRPDPAIRFYCFSGPDEAQSRSHGQRLLAGLGASKFIIASGAVRADPALLADEAAAMSLFDGKRAIWVEPAGDDIAGGVAALLSAAKVENPVVAIAGTLRKSSALLKLAEQDPAALSHISYVPEGRDAERMIAELARAEGLRLADGVAARLAAATGNDRAIAAQELAKLALYVGAMPERPAEVGQDALDAVGADLGEGDMFRLADLALEGDLRGLGEELGRLSAAGTEAIPVIRSLQRRLLMLAPLRARVEAGQSVGGVLKSLGKSLFFKDEPVVRRLLERWPAEALARVAERVGQLERDLMLRSPPAAEALGEELTAIARAAARPR